MPVYEYICTQCGHEFEELVFSSSEEVSCPECDSTKVQKKVSAVGSMGSGGGGCVSTGSGFT